MKKTNLFVSVLLFLSFSILQISSLTQTNQDFEKSESSRTLEQGQEHAHEVHCSRERSRAAWQIIDKYLMPFVKHEHYEIPCNCRLHPDNDLFRDQEEHKIHLDINEWQCGYCKKSFRAEMFLDQHFDNRHYNLLNVVCGLYFLALICQEVGTLVQLVQEAISFSAGPLRSGSKCLAGLCGALHCDAVMNAKSSRTKCNPAAVARNHHLCEGLANSCFPINQSPSARRLNEFFLHQFCHAHTCLGKRKLFPRGGTKHTSVFYLAISILTLMLLPIFYLIVYLHQREMRKGTQELRRIPKVGQKTKPS